MSASKYSTVAICLALARTAWAQPAPAPVPLDERVTGQITPGSGLTADEAAHRAVAASLEIEAGRQDTAAARASVQQARAGYVPRLSVTARYTRLSDIEQPDLGAFMFPVLLNQYLFQAQLQIPLSDYLLRVPPGVAAAKSATRAAELTTSATTQRIETDTRLAYYSWVRARLSVTVAEQAVEQARAHLEDVRKAFNVGSASRADILRVESQVAQGDLSVVRARNLAELTEARLRTAMRDTSGAPLAIGEDVLADVTDAEDPLEAQVKSAYDRRPELGAVDANVEALRGQAKVTRAAYLPRLDLFANAAYANPNQRIFLSQDEFRGTWEAGATLTWTPSDIFTTGAALDQNRARSAALQAQRGALADAIRLEVLSARLQMNEARAAVAASAQTLTTATEAYRVRRALFQNGRATSLELTDAELDLTRARLDTINARVDLREARARLAKAVGEAK